MKLRIAGAQLPVTRDVARNTSCILRAIRFAQDQGADVLLTPEGSLSGYTHEFDPDQVREALRTVESTARDAGIGLALATCFVEAGDRRCYNQLRFYERDGTFVGFHSKTLTCGTLGEESRGEINHYAVAPLRTFSLGGIVVGGLICNDLWANPGCTPCPDPHLSQQLSDRGAQMIFHAVNGGRDGSLWSQVAWRYHEANLCMRARAARAWIVTVDSCYPAHLPCSAPSGVISPSGNWVRRVEPMGEQFFAISVDTSSC